MGMTETAIKAQQDAVRALKALEGDLIVEGKDEEAGEARTNATAGLKTLRWLQSLNGGAPTKVKRVRARQVVGEPVGDQTAY